MAASKYSKYILTELKMTEARDAVEVEGERGRFSRPILWMDDELIEGAFHLNAAWYVNTGPTFADKPHVHENDEIIAFFGSDPSHPSDLGGEIEIWLEDEKHIIDRTAMIFVPAGMKHCPLTITRLDRPIFHFVTVPTRRYDRAV
jgi:hypothetical protein